MMFKRFEHESNRGLVAIYRSYINT